jgi:carboxylesterase type B
MLLIPPISFFLLLISTLIITSHQIHAFGRRKKIPLPDDLPSSPADAYPVFKKPPIVRLDFGTFQGSETKYTRYYKGIPYAQPPVGPYRFELPRAPKHLPGITDATAFKAGCFQDPIAPPINGFGLKRSEDCLYLNIWMPPGHTEADGLLPVMVWILPGGFTSGYASNPIYDGAKIVKYSKRKVMVVSFDYRMGIFGWSVSKEFQKRGLLNVGLKDVIFAFQWIKKHIQKFGGDPNRVTAFGESAGGILVGVLMLMQNGTQQLFDRGIIESGTAGYTLPSISEKLDGFDQILQSVNCYDSPSQMDCLKSLAPEALANNTLTDFFEPFPIIDNDLITQQPINSIEKGLVSKIPLMIGTTTNEVILFAFFL